MKVGKPICPKCGQPAIGTADIVYAVALFSGDPSDGDVEWAGETEVDWNAQTPERDENGFPMVICDNGHTWGTKIKK